MARFNFRLESILHLYRAQESEAKIALGLSAADLRLAEARLNTTQSWLPELATRPDIPTPQRFTLTPGVHASIELSQLGVNFAEAVVTQRRTELVEAKRNTELLERLRTRKLARHNEEAMKREATELLEVSMLMNLWSKT